MKFFPNIAEFVVPFIRHCDRAASMKKGLSGKYRWKKVGKDLRPHAPERLSRAADLPTVINGTKYPEGSDFMPHTTVRQSSAAPSCSLTPFVSTDEAIRLMISRSLRNLLVQDRGEFAGILSQADLLESVGLLLRAEREAIGSGICTEEVLVADVMDSEGPVLAPDAPLIEAAHLIADQNRSALPVVENGRAIGVISDTHVVRLLSARRPGGHNEAVLNHGTRVLRTVRSWETLQNACVKLRSTRLHHLPVLEGERFCGIINDRDIRLFVDSTASDDWLDRPVSELLRPNPPVLRPNDSLSRAAELMLAHEAAALPITTRDGLLVSVLTTVDLLSALIETDAVPA